MRIFGIIFCLLILGLTAYSAIVYKAPQIEADLEQRALFALSGLDAGGVDVRMEGRHAVLEGKVADEGLRARIVQVVAAVPGVLGPIDALDGDAPGKGALDGDAPGVNTVVSPYHLGAVKDENGDVAIEGLAPSEALKAAIEADAQAVFGDTVSLQIEVVGGAPEGDWRGAAGSGFDVLATMHNGRLIINDTDVMLEGEVASDAHVDAIGLFANSVPEGFNWSHDVEVRRERVTPFTFSVVKEPGGALTLTGFAPDEETKDALIAEGKSVGEGATVVADILVAEGMPDDEWPSLVKAGIGAMREMETGRFDVVDNEVAFSSDPQMPTEETIALAKEARDRLTSAQDVLSTEGEGEGSASAPSRLIDAAAVPAIGEDRSPTTTLTVDKVETGAWSISGVVPDQAAEDALVAAVQEHAGVDGIEAELKVGSGGTDDGWLQFATDHLQSLDQVRAGRLSIEDFGSHLIGVVETPEDIEPVRAALAAIDRSMNVDLQPIDPRPEASLDLKLSPDDGIVLTGALPSGLSEGEALLALGIRSYEGRLGNEGRGQADLWRQDLSRIGDVLPVFETAELSLGDGRPSLEGRVHAHADAEDVARRLEIAFGGERRPDIDVRATETVHLDGAKRANPLSGEVEMHRQGYWLPVIEIDAGEQACKERSAEILRLEKITFQRAAAGLDGRALTVLNRLAALALACLEKVDLVLEIGGHTDSRGARSMNEELSKARADAVLRALSARGVAASSLIAVGYGDALPIADNATDEGRASNRRITFEWKAAASSRAAAVEG